MENVSKIIKGGDKKVSKRIKQISVVKNKRTFRSRCLALFLAIFCLLSLSACSGLSFTDDTVSTVQDTAKDMASDVMDFVKGMTPSSDAATSSERQYYNVVRVVDGDTFVASVDGKDIKVRLIGVDTPESVATGRNAYKNCEEGKTASNFTKSLIEGKTVSLEYDVGQTDKYGRSLCYVYLEDGRMLNKVLLEEGYARLMTVQPNVKYVDDFTEIQKIARENKKGFWSSFEQWQ